MAAKSVFIVKDYRSYLRSLENEGRGFITRMADACQCQRSHLSRVLSDQLHLTTDQAFRLTRFLKMNDSESRYFMKLVEYERSGDIDYRASIKSDLEQLKRNQERLASRMQDPPIGDLQKELLYYSSWFYSAIHIIVSIPEYQTVARISQRLHLPREQVEAILERLQAMGHVKNEGGKWSIASGGVHLPEDSPLNATQHSNWRNRAVLASQNPADEGVHYTVVQSISRADYERVRQLVLEVIDKYAKIAKPSKEEELVCFLCDFFRV